MLKILACAALGALLPLGLAAQEQPHSASHRMADTGHSCGADHRTSMTMPPASDLVVAAWQAINMKMHAGMSIDFTGDPDTDFMRGMIPHHQGAIDMSILLLEHGTDADTRALAKAIIRAQEEEIAMMKRWLAARAE